MTLIFKVCYLAGQAAYFHIQRLLNLCIAQETPLMVGASPRTPGSRLFTFAQLNRIGLLVSLLCYGLDPRSIARPHTIEDDIVAIVGWLLGLSSDESLEGAVALLNGNLLALEQEGAADPRTQWLRTVHLF